MMVAELECLESPEEACRKTPFQALNLYLCSHILIRKDGRLALQTLGLG